MDSEINFEVISLDNVNLKDNRFRISTSGPSKELVESVKHIGVTTPPIIIQEKIHYIIICGFRRIEACLQLGVKTMAAQILSPKTTLDRCVKIAIANNTLKKDLNSVEKGRMVQLLGLVHQDQDELCAEASKLGLAINSHLLKKLRIVMQLNPVLQDALINDRIALPVALQLHEKHDEKTANKLAMIIGEIGLSLNRQREFVEWMVSISKRDNVPIEDLLDHKNIREVINDQEMDPKQKGRLVRQYFQSLRYPEIKKTEKRFAGTLRKLNLEKGVQLVAPPHFEGQVYSFRIDFQNYKELSTKYHNLKDVIESKALQSLWDIFAS